MAPISLERRTLRLLSITSVLANISIILFAALPLDSISGFEVVVIMLAFLGAIGCVSRSTRNHRLPGDRWCYLFTGCASLYSMLLFLWSQIWPQEYSIAVSMMLLTFAFMGLAAHVVTGGSDE